MKLYGSIASPYVARVALAMHAKGLKVAPEAAPGGGIKSPEFLKINPLGKMPAIEDGGRYLIESLVILDYLEDAYPKPALLPSNAMDRANVRLLGRLTDTYLVPQIGPLFRNLQPATRNAGEVDAAVSAIRKVMSEVEHFVSASGPYLCGASVSLADCAVAPSLQTLSFVLAMFGVTNMLDATPKLGRYAKYVTGDSVCAPVLTQQSEAFRTLMTTRS